MTIATACYLAANIAYLWVLPVSVIASGNSVLHPNAPSIASLAVTAAVGHQASGMLSAVLALSAAVAPTRLCAANHGFAIGLDPRLVALRVPAIPRHPARRESASAAKGRF